MTEQLKPCQFCGGEAAAILDDWVNGRPVPEDEQVFWVGCADNVDCEGPGNEGPYRDRDAIIAAWNRRTEVPE